ncbi:MAG: hypothetical protein LUF30_04790 [Lachnospiraceae bacterium]|nr:hypothetical protein [Lachnospiraceae bacterium]
MQTKVSRKEFLQGSAAGVAGLAVSSMLTSANASAEEAATGLKVGAAIRDITPTDDMLPIHSGNARMGLRIVGVIEGLNLRVIAAQNDDGPISLIIAVETGKGPYAPQFIKWLSEATGVAEENIFWSATHSHAAPEITDADWETMEDQYNDETGKNEGRYENLRLWGYLVKDQLIDAANEAIANMQEAEVGIGYSESYINVNRTTKYTDASTGEVTYGEGVNGAGPVDRTLAVIEFRARESQEPIAFIINYAMHGTAMYGNLYFLPEYADVNGFTEDEIHRDDTLMDDDEIENNSIGIHPDIMGVVSDYVEAANPGAVALWMSGAAGNTNPIFRNNMIYADPETGLKTESNVPGADVEAVNYYAAVQFVDVKDAIAAIPSFSSDVPITHAWGGTELPNAEEGGDPVNMYLSVMRMGDITLVGCPNEIYRGIGQEIINNSPCENTLVVNHCWTHEEESTGYCPDDYSLENGSDKRASYSVGIDAAMSELANELYEEAEPV